MKKLIASVLAAGALSLGGFSAQAADKVTRSSNGSRRRIRRYYVAKEKGYYKMPASMSRSSRAARISLRRR